MAAEAVNAEEAAAGAAHRTVAALHMAVALLVAAAGRKGAADLAAAFRPLAAAAPAVAERAADSSVIAARAARAEAPAGPALVRAVPVALVPAEVDRPQGPAVRDGVAQARDKLASARAVQVDRAEAQLSRGAPGPDRAVQVRLASVDPARVPAALLAGQALEPAEQVAREWERLARAQSQVGRERAPVAWADLIVVSEFVPAQEQGLPV